MILKKIIGYLNEEDNLVIIMSDKSVGHSVQGRKNIRERLIEHYKKT